MNEFFRLLKKAKKIYPESTVINTYEKYYYNYNVNELKKNLRLAINRKKQ